MTPFDTATLDDHLQPVQQAFVLSQIFQRKIPCCVFGWYGIKTNKKPSGATGFPDFHQYLRLLGSGSFSPFLFSGKYLTPRLRRSPRIAPFCRTSQEEEDCTRRCRGPHELQQAPPRRLRWESWTRHPWRAAPLRLAKPLAAPSANSLGRVTLEAGVPMLIPLKHRHHPRRLHFRRRATPKRDPPVPRKVAEAWGTHMLEETF